jgi:hypothetical protein
MSHPAVSYVYDISSDHLLISGYYVTTISKRRLKWQIKLSGKLCYSGGLYEQCLIYKRFLTSQLNCLFNQTDLPTN